MGFPLSSSAFVWARRGARATLRCPRGRPVPVENTKSSPRSASAYGPGLGTRQPPPEREPPAPSDHEDERAAGDEREPSAASHPARGGQSGTGRRRGRRRSAQCPQLRTARVRLISAPGPRHRAAPRRDPPRRDPPRRDPSVGRRRTRRRGYAGAEQRRVVRVRTAWSARQLVPRCRDRQLVLLPGG